MVSKEKKVGKKESEGKEMKKLIMLLGMMVILTGCSKQTRVETPPWNDRQVEQMDDIDARVPIVKITF